MKNLKLKPLYLPKDGKFKGLQVYCNKCRKWITNRMNECNHPESQVYKILVHVPGGEGKIKSKVLETREYQKAVKMTIEFRDSLENTNYETDNFLNEDDKPLRLIDCMVDYMNYLNKTGRYKRESGKIRSKSYIDLVNIVFENFILSLKDQGISTELILIDQITKKIVNVYYDYVENKNMSASYFNKHISYMQTFFNFLNTTGGYSVINPFLGYKTKTENTIARSVSKKNIDKLIKAITPENGKYEHNGGTKRNFYRPWLVGFIWLSVFTGRRIEDILKMKYSHIVEDANGIPEVIDTYNTKRMKSTNTEDFENIDPVPIIKELLDVLNIHFDYPNNKGKDRFLIDRVEGQSIENLKKVISRATSHFMKKSELDENDMFTLRNLRKTYVTNDRINNGEKSSKITHSSKHIQNKHYIDKLEIAKWIAIKSRDGKQFFN